MTGDAVMAVGLTASVAGIAGAIGLIAAGAVLHHRRRQPWPKAEEQFATTLERTRAWQSMHDESGDVLSIEVAAPSPHRAPDPREPGRVAALLGGLWLMVPRLPRRRRPARVRAVVPAPSEVERTGAHGAGVAREESSDRPGRHAWPDGETDRLNPPVAPMSLDEFVKFRDQLNEWVADPDRTGLMSRAEIARELAA